MRVADARIDLAMVHARRGDLGAVLQEHYPHERLADDYHDRLASIRQGFASTA